MTVNVNKDLMLFYLRRWRNAVEDKCTTDDVAMAQSKMSYAARQEAHAEAEAAREKHAQEIACIEQVIALVERQG
jgi:hypothetical protein